MIKRLVGFGVLLAVGLVAVVVINREQATHAIQRDFTVKVLGAVPCSPEDQRYLEGLVSAAHQAVFPAHAAEVGGGLRNDNAYVADMLNALARRAAADGRSDLEQTLRNEAEAYRR